MPRYTFEQDRREVMGDYDVEPRYMWAIFDKKAGRSFPIAYTYTANIAQQICDALNSNSKG